MRQQFTAKERDNETGLDYFLARYYSSTQGRFTSTDPLEASARLRNPQTWNRYTYVLNNPLRLVDPDGLSDKDPFTVLMQVVQTEPRRKHHLPREAKNKVNPNAPVPGQANFSAPYFSDLNSADETRAVYRLLRATYGDDAREIYDNWTEYDQAVFLNTVAAIQDAFGNKVSWDGVKFEGFYRHGGNDARTGLAYGIKLSGVTGKMLDKAELGKSGLFGIGDLVGANRRSPERIATASLEASEHGGITEFDIDLYNLKGNLKNHNAEVNWNRDNVMSTHPADVTRALNGRQVKTGVTAP